MSYKSSEEICSLKINSDDGHTVTHAMGIVMVILTFSYSSFQILLNITYI